MIHYKHRRQTQQKNEDNGEKKTRHLRWDKRVLSQSQYLRRILEAKKTE